MNRDILTILADGKLHSGEDIGSKLGISRAAICKAVQKLAEVGIDINSTTGKGYQIPNGLSLLDKAEIERHLSIQAQQKINYIDLQDNISSTNTHLLKNIETLKSGSVALAEYQTAGRGRRGRSWHAPYASNINLSLLWQFDKDPTELNGLSLTIGIAVRRALCKYGVPNELQLKWPNDVFYQNKKLGGILLEMTGEPNSEARVIIGIGINTAIFTNMLPIDQPWIDIAIIMQQIPDRNKITALLLNELTTILDEFNVHGFNRFVDEWQKHDMTRGKDVTVIKQNTELHGTVDGVNHHGELLFREKNGKLQHFITGEVSLRKHN